MDDDWWDTLLCFNAYSLSQQHSMVVRGFLPFPWTPEESNRCRRKAEVGIETKYDEFPGMRFYCRPCAVEHLGGVPSKPC